MRDPDPLVPDANLDDVRPSAHRRGDRAALRRELDCVLDEVVDDLFELLAVRVGDEGAVPDLGGELEPTVERVARTVEEKNSQLQSDAKIKKFTVLPVDFTQEGGELTPTLKVKRKVVSNKYMTTIEELYR